MNAAHSNPFDVYLAMGYEWLTPITPPGCKVRFGTKLERRLRTGKDSRGKAPGEIGEDGAWNPPDDWNDRRTTPALLRSWRAMGAGLGIVCREGTVALDADVLVEDYSAAIKTEVAATIGSCPIRIGRYPTRLYVFRTDPAFGAKSYSFGGETPGLIEVLASRKQFVAHGMHQTTGEPYRWESPLVPFSELPYIEPVALIAMINRILARLPAPDKTAKNSAPTVGERRIKGPLPLVAEAMAAIPNIFPDRATYINIGYALKSALQDHPQEAWALWQTWCEEWGGENAPETIEADWRSFGVSQTLGVNFLIDTAKTMSRGKVDLKPQLWCEHVGEPAPLGPVAASTFAGLPAPKQEWLVRDLIPARNVTMLSGDGATGKSLIMLQLGASIATATDWMGLPVAAGRVLFLTAEDEMKELHRRVENIEKGNPGAHSREKLGDLFMVSLNGLDAVLAAPMGKEGLLKATELMGTVKAWVTAVKPVLLVLDTQADLFGGDENKKIHARQFIGLLHGLVNEFDMTVVLVSHPSMSGMASGSGMSGNTAWNNSVRSRLYFERRFSGKDDKDEKDPDIRVLTSKKANRARIGVKYVLRYVNGIFVREGVEEDSVAADRDREIDTLFMKILEARNSQKRNVSHLLTVKDYAPRVFSQHPLANGFSLSQFEDSMERLFAAERIDVEEFGPPSHRRNRLVAKESPPSSEPSNPFFD